MGFGIITGKTGFPHITSYDDAVRNYVMAGRGKYILGVGNKLATELISFTSGLRLRILDGYVINQGRLMGIPLGDSDEITIMSEASSETRTKYACLVARYSKNIETGLESAGLAVIYGELSDDPVLPEVYNNDLLDDVNLVDDVIIHVFQISGPNVSQVDSALLPTRIWDYTDWMDNGAMVSYTEIAKIKQLGSLVKLRGSHTTNPGLYSYTWSMYLDLAESITYYGFEIGEIPIDYINLRPKKVVSHRFAFTLEGESFPPDVQDIITGVMYICPDGKILVNPDRYHNNYQLEFELTFDDVSWTID